MLKNRGFVWQICDFFLPLHANNQNINNKMDDYPADNYYL